MKTAFALTFALLLAGCASGPYYAGYDGYQADRYGYDGYGYFDGYGPYGNGYANPYDGYPAVLGGSFYYYRHDDGRGWDRRDHGDRNWRQGRGPGERRTWREENDSQSWREPGQTRHGEAGNEAGMGRARGGEFAPSSRGESGNEAR